MQKLKDDLNIALITLIILKLTNNLDWSWWMVATSYCLIVILKAIDLIKINNKRNNG